MKVAIVGLGYWGPVLVRNLMSLESCSSLVVCDSDPARVTTSRGQYPWAIGSTDFNEVLDDKDVRAVVVATPVLTHARLATEALKAGKSVLVEKPLAGSLDDARALVNSRDAGQPGHGRPHVPLQPAGLSGEEADRQRRTRRAALHPVVAGQPRHPPGRCERAVGPGAARLVDRARCGSASRPMRVSAIGRSSVPGAPIDVAFVNLDFASGVVANLHLSWLAPTKVRRTTLVCTARMVVYEDSQPEEPVKIYNKGLLEPEPRGLRPVPHDVSHRRRHRAVRRELGTAARRARRLPGHVSRAATRPASAKPRRSTSSPPSKLRNGPSTCEAPLSTSEPIPLADLSLQHAAIADEVARGWAEVIASTSYILGESTYDAFEEEFAAYCGVDAAASASPTAPTPSNWRCAPPGSAAATRSSFRPTPSSPPRWPPPAPEPTCASSTSIRGTQLLDPEAAVRRHRTEDGGRRAGAPLRPDRADGRHRRGRRGPRPRCDRGRRPVPGRDAATATPWATGATRCATSFFPGKNLGAYGDGGAVVTRHPEVAAKLRALRNYGSEIKYEHPELGFNSRLDTLQAVVLSAKLKLLDGWNEQRRDAATRYDELLRGLDDVRAPRRRRGQRARVAPVRGARARTRPRARAPARRADLRRHPLPHDPCRSRARSAPPTTTRAASPSPTPRRPEILTLPLFPGITAAQQERVAATLAEALA